MSPAFVPSCCKADKNFLRALEICRMSPRFVFLTFGRGQRFVECPLFSSLRVEIALFGEGLSYVTFLSS